MKCMKKSAGLFVCILFFATLNVYAQDDFTPLQKAVLAGDYAKVEKILGEDPDAVNEPCSSEASIVTALGADVSIGGAAALHLALVKQDERMVRLLLARGASIYAVDNDDWDVITYAAAFGSVPCLAVLVERNAQMRQRIKSTRAPYGSTLLHQAAVHNTSDMAQYLIEECGLDVNALDEDGETALEWADRSAEDNTMVEYLKSAGGTFGLLDYDDDCPCGLHCSCCGCSPLF